MSTIETVDSMPPATAPTAPAFRRWKNYPRAGIDFPDINTLGADGSALARIAADFAAVLPADLDIVAGIDLGGAALAGAVARARGCGFMHIRKIGSLRTEIIRNFIENHEIAHDLAVSRGVALCGRRIALIDDCLLSGETVIRAARLLGERGAICDRALVAFEIDGLGGRERLAQAGLALHAAMTVPQRQAE